MGFSTSSPCRPGTLDLGKPFLCKCFNTLEFSESRALTYGPEIPSNGLVVCTELASPTFRI